MKLTPKKDILMNFLEETWKYILPSLKWIHMHLVNKQIQKNYLILKIIPLNDLQVQTLCK